MWAVAAPRALVWFLTAHYLRVFSPLTRIRLLMVSIGFRVSPSRVTFALVKGTPHDGFTLVNASAVLIPPALETARQLQFVRTTLLDVMDEYAVSRAGLRISEAIARRNPFRLNLEGVVQELLASSQAELYVTGPIATIAPWSTCSPRRSMQPFITVVTSPSRATLRDYAPHSVNVG